jgi:hypothetical protein
MNGDGKRVLEIDPYYGPIVEMMFRWALDGQVQKKLQPD